MNLTPAFIDSMRKKGGRPRSLTIEQAEDIRADKRPIMEIAAEYNVSHGTISAIKHGNLYEEATNTAFVAPPGARPKLQDSDYAEIRASSEKNNVLAERYGVTAQRIWQIRKKWKPANATDLVAVVDGVPVPRGRKRMTKEEEVRLLERHGLRPWRDFRDDAYEDGVLEKEREERKQREKDEKEEKLVEKHQNH